MDQPNSREAFKSAVPVRLPIFRCYLDSWSRCLQETCEPNEKLGNWDPLTRNWREPESAPEIILAQCQTSAIRVPFQCYAKMLSQCHPHVIPVPDGSAWARPDSPESHQLIFLDLFSFYLGWHRVHRWDAAPQLQNDGLYCFWASSCQICFSNVNGETTISNLGSAPRPAIKQASKPGKSKTTIACAERTTAKCEALSIDTLQNEWSLKA